MSSRLDRLFLLLENGGSDATRHAAALQLGEIVRLHPHELETLLERLHSFITSKTWETRIAASQAVEAIISNIPKWEPVPSSDNENLDYSLGSDLGDKNTTETLGHLSLESFNIRRVLEKGSYLLGADEAQFVIEDENSKIDPKERAIRQRLLVNQRLGLDIADALGINTQNIFSNADLTYYIPDKQSVAKNCVGQIVQEEMASAGLKMSSRELNRAKRKAKYLSKQKSNEPTDKSFDEGSEKKRQKVHHYVEERDSEDEENNLTIADDRAFQDQDGEWPLDEFAEHLSRDLFSCSWETRHGVATALREVIRVQGIGAGKASYLTAQQMEISHLSWLEDKALRLVCVLALDRFGDFLADQVIAPVRETCAQALGCIVQHVPKRIVLAILSLLQEMLLWQDWGTRHGGLLGLKYLLAVRADMRQELLTLSYDYIYKGLHDEMDDVVAVAATCLVPVAEDLVEFLPCNTVNELLGTLWEALLDIDDLTASTNSILLLISKLLRNPKILNKFDGDLSQLIPRLWPFLYHSNCSIRTSSLKALETLLENRSQNMLANKNVGNDTSEMETPQTTLKNESICDSLHNKLDHVSIDSVEISALKREKSTEENQNESNYLGKDFSCESENKESNLIHTEFTPANGKMQDEIGIKPENKIKLRVTDNWLEQILESLLVHMYQRGLLENSKENIELIEKIWDMVVTSTDLSSLLLIACRLLPTWLYLLMSSAKAPLDMNFIVFAHHSKSGDGLKKTRRLSELGESVSKMDTNLYIGGSRNNLEERCLEDQVVMARCTVAKLLGNLSHYVSQPMPSVEYQPDETPILCYVRLLVAHLSSRSGIQRFGAGLVVREWALQHPTTLCHSILKASLLNCVTDAIYYDEIAWMFTRLQQDAKDFIAILKHYKIPVDSSLSAAPVLTLDQIQKLCELHSSNMSSVKLRKNVSETLESRNKSIHKNVMQTSSEQIKLSVTIQSVIAGALVRFKSLPEKLNPVIKPLMESIKRENNELQQKMAALDLTFLLELCIDRQPSPNAKVVKNLCSFLCVDEDFTPNIIDNPSVSLRGGIISLLMQQKISNDRLYRRNSSSGGRCLGRPPLNSTPSTSSESGDSSAESTKDVETKKQNAVQRRGCTLALLSIVSYFGSDLGHKLPHFVNIMFEPLENPSRGELTNLETAQDIINWLQLLEIIIPVLHNDYIKKFEGLLSVFDLWLYHPYAGVRHMAGRAFAVLGAVSTNAVVCYVIENMLNKLDVAGPKEHRMGALECVHLTIEKLGFAIVSYIVLLIVPLLGCMSDPEENVRHLGTQCFATLIRLFPLDGSANTPLNISPNLLAQINKERLFLDRLLDPKKIGNYKIPVPINAVLRTYQQQGVNWLAFLNKYNLHGILCDDMGLGKTLQSICILAGDHFEKEQQFMQNKEKASLAPCKRGHQSLVVCPPTLTGHWYYEIVKFISKEYLDPLHYSGLPTERKRLRQFFRDHNVIIASYKIVRNEVDFFSKIKWNYIILDEGHTIKNGKTKSSKAVKELVGKHRLILTGTPIQNHVLELWSLFDFLMPGFLGTERQFMARYSKPIVQSKEAKSSSREQEAGVLALEALHRQVLPFLLRRVKEDVLKDLPPKITQDYYCELSPLQERLYEDFARSQTCQTIDQTLGTEEKKSHGHIFQALQYLRRVCNHPKLALLPSHPQYEAISRQVRESRTPLSDISHSAKLPALKQLLLDCGIGSSEETISTTLTASSVVSPHRALIFCQLKGMLDIIEKDLLKVHLPTVTYLRLDGSVPAGSRHSLVHRFNTDPSIDLLLLTTHVGGLGLNLTGADTVIFVEHDWNPMRDLQAMDRAHRIGQKRVVNVYRLITKGTLEEKIMSLQKFKLMTANSVISQENSSLLSMGTDQLLELFTLDAKGSKCDSSVNDPSNGDRQTLGLKSPGIKEAIQNLPALWEEGLYEEEYNLDSFLQTLK